MKPNDEAYQAAIAEGKRWDGSDFTGWKVLREDDIQNGWDIVAEFDNREERDEALERLRSEAMVNAAYAAQFQSGDYAGLVERLRSQDELYVEKYVGTYDVDENKIEPLCDEAADAIETLLAERAEHWENKKRFAIAHAALRTKELNDELERLEAELDDAREQLALRSESGMAKDMQEIMRINNELVAERDALAARLAPVDDKALVEIVADAIDTPLPSLTWEEREGAARAVIAAIRPHIEAAAYDDAATFIDENVYNYSTTDQNYWTKRKGDNANGLEYAKAIREKAAAIRSGK